MVRQYAQMSAQKGNTRKELFRGFSVEEKVMLCRIIDTKKESIILQSALLVPNQTHTLLPCTALIKSDNVIIMNEKLCTVRLEEVSDKVMTLFRVSPKEGFYHPAVTVKTSAASHSLLSKHVDYTSVL